LTAKGFVESVQFDFACAPHPVLGLGGKEPEALRVQAQAQNFGVMLPFEKGFPYLQGSQIGDLGIIQAEQGLVALAVEVWSGEKQERAAGVDDEVGVFTQVVGGVGEEGGAGQMLAARLEGFQYQIEHLAVSEMFPKLIENEVFGETQIGAVLD